MRFLDFLGRLAWYFTDHRDPKQTEHSVRELVRQRVFGLALGYEDLNDHAELRTADINPGAGIIEIIEFLVKQIRARWPDVTIILRDDSGFARDKTTVWREDNSVEYVLGLGKNARLTPAIEKELAQAKAGFEQTGKATRVFKDFRYRTKKVGRAGDELVRLAVAEDGPQDRPAGSGPMDRQKWQRGVVNLLKSKWLRRRPVRRDLLGPTCFELGEVEVVAPAKSTNAIISKKQSFWLTFVISCGIFL